MVGAVDCGLPLIAALTAVSCVAVAFAIDDARRPQIIPQIRQFAYNPQPVDPSGLDGQDAIRRCSAAGLKKRGEVVNIRSW